MKAAGCVTTVTECDPICALQAAMEGFQVKTLESQLDTLDIVITTTGNKGIIMNSHMPKMRDNAIVGNIGHFDNEIDMEGLMKATKRINIKPQVDKFVYSNGKGPIVRHVQLLHEPDARAARALEGEGLGQVLRRRPGQVQGVHAPENPRRKGRGAAPHVARRRAHDALGRAGRLHRRAEERAVQARDVPLLDARGRFSPRTRASFAGAARGPSCLK